MKISPIVNPVGAATSNEADPAANAANRGSGSGPRGGASSVTRSGTTLPVADHGGYNSDSEDDTSDDPGPNQTPFPPKNESHDTQFSSRSPLSTQDRLPKTLLTKRPQRERNNEDATEENDSDQSLASDGEEDVTGSENSLDPEILKFDSPTLREHPNSVPDSDADATPAKNLAATDAAAAAQLAASVLQANKLPPPATATQLADAEVVVDAENAAAPLAVAPPHVTTQPGSAAAPPPPAAAAQLATTALKANTQVGAAATPRLADAENAAAPLAEARNLPRLPVPPADSSSLSYMPEAAAAPLAVAPPHVTTPPAAADADTAPQRATTPPPAAADADTAPQRATTPQLAATTKVSKIPLNSFSVPKSLKRILRGMSLIRKSKDSPAAAAVTPTTPTLGNSRTDARRDNSQLAPTAAPQPAAATLGNSFSTRSGTQTTTVATPSQDSQAFNKLKGLAKIHGRSYVTSLESQFAVEFEKSPSSEEKYELYRDGQILNEQTEKNKFNDDLGKFRKSSNDDDYIYDSNLATSLNVLIPDSIKEKINEKIDELLSTIPAIQNQTQTNAITKNYKDDVKNRLTIEYAGFLSPYSSCQHSVTIAEREEFLNKILEINEEENINKILKALKNLSLDNLASKEDRRLDLDLNIEEADSQVSIYKIHPKIENGRVEAEREYINFKKIAKRIATEPLEGESKSDKESPTDLVHFHLINNYFSGGDQGFSVSDSNDDKKNKALIIFHAHKDSSANQYSYKQSIISGGDIQKFEDTIKEKQKYISLLKKDATEEKTIDQIKKLYEDGVKAYKSGQVIDEASQTDSHKKLAIALVAQDFLDCQVFSDKYISKTPDTQLNQAASSQDSSSSKLQNDLDEKFADIVVPNKQYHALGGIFQKGITISRHQDEENKQGSTESAQGADKFVNVVNVWDKSSPDQQKSAFVAINNPPYEISFKGITINATFFRKIAFTKEGKIRFSENIYYEDEKKKKQFFKIKEINECDGKVKLLEDLAALKIKTTYVAMDKNEIKTVDKSYTGFNKESYNYEVKQPAADIRSATIRNVAGQTNPLRQGGGRRGEGCLEFS